MFRGLALRQSGIRRVNVRNVSFKTLYGGQFTLSTQLIIQNYPVILYHRHSTTVTVQTYTMKNIKLSYVSLFLSIADEQS